MGRVRQRSGVGGVVVSRFISCSIHRDYEISDLFGPVVAMSINGNQEVPSGLTRQFYFWYDHQNHGYHVERR